MLRFTRLAGLLIATLAVASTVQAASPSLTLILPRGVQRGTEAELTFTGARLGDTEEILFYQPGVTVNNIESDDPNRVKVNVTIAPDCRLGEHICCVRTESGISDYRTFWVGALPIIEEKEPNTDFEAPQPIDLNVTVHGVVQGEDVDYYVVEAKKGQRIAVEIEAMRLGTTLFDPYVAILDSKRFELAAEDDTPLVLQDAVAAIVAPEDGKYYIQVRESAYGGNGNCRYRLHVGTFPRPTAVYPAGGKLGEEVEVKFLGDPAGEIVQKVKLPDAPIKDFGLFATVDGQIAPSENPFRLFEHGNALEVEPNNDFATATPAQLPLAFNGIIGEAGDVDVFKFAAKKGEVYEIECYARRIRSGLDPVMSIHAADGRRLANNDDSRGPDSYIRFNVPADGEYAIRVTDHLGRGGQDFVYRLEFSPVKQSLALGIPRVTRYGQERQQVVVARGNRFGTIISASRANFGGELKLDGANLPKGITMIAETMPANLNTMPVVFEAASDAEVAGALIDFTARHTDPNQNITGGFRNEADFIIGPPGQSRYRTCSVDQLPIAVVDEIPFSIEIIEPKVPLVQNGSMQLKIVAHRKEGFKAPITVEFPFRSPGVGTVPNVTIPEGQTEVFYPLNANGNAAVGKWRVFALAYANVDAGSGERMSRRGRRGRGVGQSVAFASSQLATIEVAPPYVQFAMERSAVEQAKETEIVVKVTHNKPFEGAAKVKLVGLPNKVTAPELDLTKDMAELIFKVSTDATSPPGTHKNIFCQVVITENGEPISHNVGSTELRIDKPLPPPKTPAPTPMPTQVAEQKPMPQPMPEKRLSRLEQLRIEAMKKAAEAGGSE